MAEPGIDGFSTATAMLEALRTRQVSALELLELYRRRIERGQPATAFPVGLTPAGLPIGLQAIGPYLEDRTSIRFAALIERECGGYHRPPGYAEV